MHKNKQEIRDSYLNNEILLIGTKLTEGREVIDRRSNYVVVVDSTGSDSKLFLDEAYSSILVETPTKRSYRSFVKTIQESSPAFTYKGYVTKNFDQHGIRACFESLVLEDKDQYALLHAIKAVDQLVEDGNVDTLARARKYINTIDVDSNHPYLDVVDMIEKVEKPTDKLAVITKFVKVEPPGKVIHEKSSYSDFKGSVITEDFQKNAEAALHKIAQNPKVLSKMADNVKSMEDIAHHYDQDDLHYPKAAAVKEDLSELKPLYVCRHLLNPLPFIEWAKSQGFKKTLTPDELHVTVVFSKSDIDWELNEPDIKNLTIKDGKRSVIPLGDKGAVVLKFDSKALQDRWNEFKAIGASWSYPSYNPHVSITYDGTSIDLSKVKPYEGELVFGPEVYQPIDDNYIAKVVEEGVVLKTETEVDAPVAKRIPSVKKLSTNSKVFKVATRTATSLLASKLASKPIAKASKKEKDFIMELLKKNVHHVIGLAKRIIPKILSIEASHVAEVEKTTDVEVVK